MKKILIFLLTSFISQHSFATETKTYVRADYGIGNFKSEKLDVLNANPSGSTMGVGFGAKMDHVELGIFFKNFKYSKDIINDGVANKFEHAGKSFGFDMNVFLNNHLSLKLGYAFNTYKQSFATSVSAATLKSMNSTYGVQSDYSSSSIFYGAGINLFAGKSFDTTISVVNFPMGSGSNSLSAQIGFVFYMDKSFADFFGTN